MRVSIILGTRPEIVKMSPIILECERRGLEYFVLHTGQHYDYELDRAFFEELELPEPKYNLKVGSGSHGQQTGRMLGRIERVLALEKPNVALVEGDTNTILAGALAAVKLGIKVGHVEAGLRSYDRAMPEEINRIVADHVSDYLFAPTEKARGILLGEGIGEGKVFVTGNTIVDAVLGNLARAAREGKALERLNLEKEGYFLATAHRQENTDIRERLEGILEGLGLVHREFGLPIIYPIHPRTEKRVRRFGLRIPRGIELTPPLGFLDFLQLEMNARLVLTDSGGVQEETCILRVPCVTLRDNTERPETLEVGSNLLAGADRKRILEGVVTMLQRKREWPNPFGDGKSGGRILDLLKKD